MINEEKTVFYGLSKKFEVDKSFNDNFTYAFDSLSGTELKVSLNGIFSVRAYPGSEFVVANTLATWKKLEPMKLYV